MCMTCVYMYIYIYIYTHIYNTIAPTSPARARCPSQQGRAPRLPSGAAATPAHEIRSERSARARIRHAYVTWHQRLGQDITVQDGYDRTGQDRTGSNRAEQGRTGQGSTG